MYERQLDSWLCEAFVLPANLKVKVLRSFE